MLFRQEKGGQTRDLLDYCAEISPSQLAEI